MGQRGKRASLSVAAAAGGRKIAKAEQQPCPCHFWELKRARKLSDVHLSIYWPWEWKHSNHGWNTRISILHLADIFSYLLLYRIVSLRGHRWCWYRSYYSKNHYRDKVEHDSIWSNEDELEKVVGRRVAPGASSWKKGPISTWLSYWFSWPR